MIDEKKLIEVLKKHFDADYGEDGRLLYSDHVCTGDDVEDIIKLVEEQPRVDVPDTNVGEWIPCSEPPKYTGDYLVTVGINRDGFGMYDEVRTANYNTVYEKWTVHEDWKNAIATNPIAWMPLPLPQPYVEGDKE